MSVILVKTLDTDMTIFWFEPTVQLVLCPIGGSRGLVQGRLWRSDGVLAASCSQEGVLRVTPVRESSKL